MRQVPIQLVSIMPPTRESKSELDLKPRCEKVLNLANMQVCEDL
jgi:hypothetical protein